ncbi:MAG TPA: hypothetical protein VHL34_16875 [Rhizomicrobium sp.]|jgi:hypothetical protein|nr:hypothetical protein [Rhizomicrobium sp.]
MSELDLLNLSRGTTDAQMSYFAQMITISFAMVVAIYYFLNQAKLPFKVFAYLAYFVGMGLFFSQMLFETNVKVGILQQLQTLPHPSAVTVRYLALYDSWLGMVTRIFMNGAIWILSLGIFYLLFFWKKEPQQH